MPQLPTRTIKLTSDFSDASKPIGVPGGTASLTWYKGETVTILAQVQEGRLPVTIADSMSVRMVAWAGTATETLYIDSAGSVSSQKGGILSVSLTPEYSALPPGSYNYLIRVYDADGVDLGISHAGILQVLANPSSDAVFAGPFATVDWSSITSYSNTAASGPYTAGTYVAFGTADGNGRVPISVSAHAASHATGGSDPLTAADIGAVGLTGEQTMQGPLILKTGTAQRLRLNGTDTGASVSHQYDSGGGVWVKFAQWIAAAGSNVFDYSASDGGVWRVRKVPDSTNSSDYVIQGELDGTVSIYNGLNPKTDDAVGFGTAALKWLAGYISTLYTSTVRALSGALVFQDSAGAEHGQISTTGMRIRPRVVSSSITAELDGVYHVTASATISDPGTPAEGRGYTVLVINGTATVNSIGYAVAGTVIRRVYHSGAWQTVRVYLPPGNTITESGTTRTLGRSDVGQMIRLTNAGACTITVPANATTAFEDGDTIMFRVTTVSPAALTLGDGVTVNNGSAITSLPQHSTFALRRTSTTDVWDLI